MIKRLKKPQKNIKNNSEVKKNKNVETPENLRRMLAEYTALHAISSSKVKRLEDIISRPSFTRLSETKRSRLIKKFETATEESKFSEQAIDQLTFRISQIT